ncbi:hypothetical protein LTR08_002909 [Meristemomyces frigidus]|nr:hypothetical protein LTR08_002909 [Meristemomyces frigidus]
MDSDKPFKTIEVIDSKTLQVSKIACMSCIRGHRTTACGIPVCRTKLFWTVKRPGRPANACSCRYGGLGGCKCVVAKSSCPHKSKKGEKRSGECRCDEQGRYCCLLEPPHWDMLLSLQKPTVEFFSTREDLDSHAVPTPMSLPMTPNFPSNSPRAFSTRSVSSTPGPPTTAQPMQMMSSQFNSIQSPLRNLTPQFGMMAVGSPQGNENVGTPDMLSWDGQAPLATREFHPLYYQSVSLPEERSSCCQTSSNPPPSEQYISYAPPSQQIHSPPSQSAFDPFADIMSSVSTSEQQLQQAAYDKFNIDYLAYQFPSAICQTCGLSGCTCRNCPPVMQNSNNGSWAQCCGRKHARTATYVAPATLHAYEQQPTAPAPQQLQLQAAHFDFPERSYVQGPTSQQPFPYRLPPEHLFEESRASSFGLENGPYPPQQPLDLQSPQLLDDFIPFDPGEHFALPEGATAMDLSELLMADLEQPDGGCCCADP